MTASAPARLPRGRHGLSREEVRDSQRRRMLTAMAAAVAERGYVRTPVAEVIGRAGVSRETFYLHFANKEECFLAAFDDVVARLRERVLAVVVERVDEPAGGHADPLARLNAAVGAYLEVLASERPLARTFLIEVYGAGPAALRRRVAVFDGFVDLVADAIGAADPERRATCEALVAAASALVTMRVAVDDREGLLAVRPQLLALARRLLGGR